MRIQKIITLAALTVAAAGAGRAAAGGAAGGGEAALEKRLQEIEAKLTVLTQENAALKAQLGLPSASGAGANGPSAAVTAPAAGLTVRLQGDLRGRVQGTYDQAEEAIPRDQMIFRVRTGLVLNYGSEWEGGLRLAAGNLNANYGGSPLTTQYVMGDNAAQKYVFIDRSYLRWAKELTPEAGVKLTFGKMENPFYAPSNLLFDIDYAPEGAAAELAWKATPRDRWQFVAGLMVLDEIVTSARDPFFLGARARWEHTWNDAWSSTVTAQYLPIVHPEQLTATNIANNLVGNTRTASGVLVHDYEPIYTEATLTRTLAHFPGYPGKFPVTLQGEFIHNPGAPTQNEAWGLGLTLGRAGTAGKWEFTYRRLQMEADAVFEEFQEADFGGYMPILPPGWNTEVTSTKGGHVGGTNYRSHVFRATYSFRDYFSLTTNLLLNDVIHQYRTSTTGATTRVQVDALLKF